MNKIRALRKLTRDANASCYVRFLSMEKHFRYKGTVKFYLREKGYGFIIPDGSDRGLFVHQSTIAGADQLPDEVQLSTCRYPYLLENERVSFEIIHDADRDGKEMAVQVRFVDEKIIPPERPDFLASVKDDAFLVLGEKVYDIVNNLELNVGSKLKQIQQVHREAQATIQKAEKLIQMLGMKPDDFLDLDTKRKLEEKSSLFYPDPKYLQLRYSIPPVKGSEIEKYKT